MLGDLDNSEKIVKQAETLKHDFFIVNCWPDRLYSIDSFVFRRETLNNISPDGFYEYNTMNQKHLTTLLYKL